VITAAYVLQGVMACNAEETRRRVSSECCYR